MSVVAVKVTEKNITIGADSIIAFGWTQEKDRLAKLEEVNGMVIGSVGMAQEGALFRVFCRTRKPREATDEAIVDFMSEFQDWLNNKIGETKIENGYILVVGGKAFNVEGFYVKEVTDYSAIGAGMDFALASLYLGNSVKESIKASCHLSVYCEEPINIIKIDKK
jgi:ATP-dependent protease HslVU (ClpYQ) peptidase subunit